MNKDIDSLCKVVHNYRQVVIAYNVNRGVIIREDLTVTPSNITVSFVYKDNPHDPIDDADTGSGYYPHAEKDNKLATEIIEWYEKNIK